MEEIEYLEEYEDLILPMSFAVDDGKCNDRLNDRKSIDSLEMLYKDLIEDTSLQANQADTSPFSLNPQMISPEKTILSSSTVEIGLAQSFPNYSLATAPTTYANTTNTDTLHSYQTPTSNIQYLNRLTNKSFSTYSSLQKPDKLKSVATVKPTLQRVNNLPKQYVQRESPNFKTSISGQSVAQSQHNFSKPSSTKTSFGYNNTSKSKSSLKLSKHSASGVDPLAGLDDDALLDFDERNGLVDGFDFESDLDNSIIAGLSDMDSDSVELSDEFIDDNFDLESDLSSEESDLKKLLKRKRSRLSTQDSKLSSDLKRDVSNSVKKKLSPNNKYGLEGQQHTQKGSSAELKEKLPTSTSSLGKDSSFINYSTKVTELIANGNNILPQLSSKLNEHEHAHVSNVLNLTPTVPLCSEVAEKTENGFKQFIGITSISNEKSSHQKKDDRTHSIVDQFKGFDESLISKSMEQQADDVVKNKLIDQNLHKTPQNNNELSNQNDGTQEKSPRLKFGSLYLRSIKPPLKNTSLIKSPTNLPQQLGQCKTPTVPQSTKVPDESSKSLQENTSTSPTKNVVIHNSVAKTVSDFQKKLNSEPSSSDAKRIREKSLSVPKISEARDQKSTENVKEFSQTKRSKSLGTLNACMSDKEATTGKVQNSGEKPKVQSQPRVHKVVKTASESTPKKETSLARIPGPASKKEINPVRIQESTLKKETQPVRIQETASKKETNSVRIQESTPRKEIKIARTQEVKKRDSVAKPKVQTQSTTSLSTPKAPETKEDDVFDKPTEPTKQLRRKSNVEEKIVAKFGKGYAAIKAQESKDRDVSDKLKIQNQAKLKNGGEKTAASPEKSSTPKAHEAKEQDLPEQLKVKANIKRRRSVAEKNRNKSAEREANKKTAPVTESKEKDEKQMKTVQKGGGDKRLGAVFNETTSTQSSNSHQKTNKTLPTSTTTLPSQSDKTLSLQQIDETSPQKKTSPLVQEKSLASNRRKRIALRKFQGPNPKLKKTLDSQEVPDPPPDQAATVMAEKTASVEEYQKLVILSQKKPVPQLLPRDNLQKVRNTTAASPKPRSKKSSSMKSGKFSKRKLKPMSPRNFSSLEQKKLKLRRFKICLNRNTVDHFMKSLNDHASSTPQSITKTSKLEMVKSPLKDVQGSKIVSPRPVGRPKKMLAKPSQESQSPSSAELNEVRNESQPLANSSSVTPVKVAQAESKVEDKVSLEVMACPTMKKRKKKNMRTRQPAKILRSDITPSTDKSDIPDKDCTNDRVTLNKSLPDVASRTTENPAIQTEDPTQAVRTEATSLPVPVEVSNLEVQTNVISPIASTKITSPTVPTIASSPTFPTEAVSPATPTGATSLEIATATSKKSPQTGTTETSPTSPTLPNLSHSRKRGRPFSKKTLRRAALARRLELIRASTSQRLINTNTTVDPTPEERALEPVPVEREIEPADECISNETNEVTSLEISKQTDVMASLATSQPPDKTNEIVSQATVQPPDGPRLEDCNAVQPKIEVGDSISYQLPGTTMFDGAPAVYSFARPTNTLRRNSELLLDTCQIIANSCSTDQSSAIENATVFDLPSYIVMRTRIITRSELQMNKSIVPPQVKETIDKLTESGHVAPLVKEESPDFKDICLEINTLLGRNANYLKFASASERQARMTQVLSDTSLSVQEAQSALKFLQSYLSVRSKDVVVNNAKGQQFIPIYDSQKKVIGYRKRRVHPKKSEQTKQPSRLLNRSSNPSTSRTTSINCTTPITRESLNVQHTIVEFSTKEEPQTVDGGDEELIVPDTTLSSNPIKCEMES